jgi:hypothetical protein
VGHVSRHCQSAGPPASVSSFDGERALAMIERACAVVRSLRSLRSLWFDLFVFAAENTESAESWQHECRGGCYGQRGLVGTEIVETVDTLSSRLHNNMKPIFGVLSVVVPSIGYLGSAVGIAIGGSVGGQLQMLFLLGTPMVGIGCAVYAFVRHERLPGIAGVGLVMSIVLGWAGLGLILS